MIKAPNAVLDYGFNWRPEGEEWLEEDETITSYVITVPTGIVKESDSESDGVVTVWLSGGTVGQNYKISAKSPPQRTGRRAHNLDQGGRKVTGTRLVA